MPVPATVTVEIIRRAGWLPHDRTATILIHGETPKEAEEIMKLLRKDPRVISVRVIGEDGSCPTD